MASTEAVARRELDRVMRLLESRDAELEQERQEKRQLELQIEGLSRRVCALQSELDRASTSFPARAGPQPLQPSPGSGLPLPERHRRFDRASTGSGLSYSRPT